MSLSIMHRQWAKAQTSHFIAGVHALRTLGLGLGALAVAAVFWRNGAPTVEWLALGLNGLVWPHLARVLAQRSGDPVNAERRNILIDSLLGGVWIALMRFNLVPSAVLLTVLAMDCVAVGGVKLLWRGWLLQAGACAVSAALAGFAFAPTSEMLEMLAAMPFLMTYPIALSAATYRLSRRVRQQNRLLARVSSMDGLSDLLNRTHWEEAVAGVLGSCGVAGHNASLLMLDIDHFKQINDFYGHTVGDDVIGRIGAIIRRNMREGDIAGRYGGDEFGVVLNGVSATVAARIAERIRASVHAATFEQAEGLRCTLSIGIAQADASTRDARDWIRQADVALYNAKLRGRNRLASAVRKRELESNAA